MEVIPRGNECNSSFSFSSRGKQNFRKAWDRGLGSKRRGILFRETAGWGTKGNLGITFARVSNVPREKHSSCRHIVGWWDACGFLRSRDLDPLKGKLFAGIRLRCFDEMVDSGFDVERSFRISWNYFEYPAAYCLIMIFFAAAIDRVIVLLIMHWGR